MDTNRTQGIASDTRRVVVTGMGTLNPLGNNVAATRDAIHAVDSSGIVAFRKSPA